ncbi:MAG: molybdopterin-dependent oxidoreductase, partial [Thiothrix sp.]|nr:molybdopterin-dependent oxidoreductase [Thiothrix sp.]
PQKAEAFAYEPYPRDDDLQTVVTSCAHNCGSRHMLVAHKKGDVIVRLSTDNGSYQKDGEYGKDTLEEPQVRACLRGRSYRARIYSQERLLYPMVRTGARGDGQFKRASWDAALDLVAEKMELLKAKYGPTALVDQSYAGASYGVLHKSDQIEGLLGRFLGLYGCRTSSWSVPSYEGTKFSSRMTFGTIEDGNEDDAYAHSKLIIMWGWNPAYTFHGGNTFYYMRVAKQRGCKFVLVDPQYTDSAAAYDAWWIPIRPNTDAAMMAGMAHYIFTNNLQDQNFINQFVQGMDAGTMPGWAQGQENFKDYILGTYDNTPKTPEWAAAICGVSAEDIKKLADMYATTKPAALKASWAPGRNAYGEQYCRISHALQAMTGNIGVLG